MSEEKGESNLPKDYYQYTRGGFQDHIWVVHFEDKVIHFWYHSKTLDSDDGYVCAGIETHFKQPAEYMSGEKPCREDCGFTGGKCWHDGTSMGGSDFYRRNESRIKDNDHDTILRSLRLMYETRRIRMKRPPVYYFYCLYFPVIFIFILLGLMIGSAYKSFKLGFSASDSDLDWMEEII